MPINWPMPMGDGNRAMTPSGRGQANWPQPAGDYQTSTAGGMRSPEGWQGFGGQAAMRNPDNMGFTPPTAGPASQWQSPPQYTRPQQAAPITYGAVGGPQFSYQPGSGMTPSSPGANPAAPFSYGPTAPGSQQFTHQPGGAPPGPTAGPMSMLGGMNSQQLQNILPMLQQLFASRGQGGPGGQSSPGLYGGPSSGPQFPPEGEPVVPPWQGMAGAQTTPAANGMPGYTTVPGPWTGAAPTSGGMDRGGYQRQTNPADIMARYQATGGAAPDGHVAYGTPGQSAMLPQNQQVGYADAGQSAIYQNMLSGRNGAPMGQNGYR